MTKWTLLSEDSLLSQEVRVGKKALNANPDLVTITREGDTSRTKGTFVADVQDDRGISNPSMGKNAYVHPNVKAFFESHGSPGNVTVETASPREVRDCESMSIRIHRGKRETLEDLIRGSNYHIHPGLHEVVPDAQTASAYGSFEFTPVKVKPQHHTLRVTADTSVEEATIAEVQERETETRQRVASDDDGKDLDEFLVSKEPERSLTEDAVGLSEIQQVVRAVRRINHPVYKDVVDTVYEPDRGGGVLLYGPPGCGKTLAAEGIAYDLKYRCLECKRLACSKHDSTLENQYGSIEYFELDGAELHQKYVGESPEMFKDAIQHVYNEIDDEDKFVVFFIDEADSVLANRSGTDQESVSRLTNAFLDNVEKETLQDRDMLLIAGTNFPYEIDTAALDRFTITQFFDPPEDPGEYAKLWEMETSDHANLDYDRLGAASLGYVPREIVQLIAKTTWNRIGDPDLDLSDPEPLTTEDYLEALDANPPETLDRYVNDILEDGTKLSGFGDLEEFCREWIRGSDENASSDQESGTDDT